MNSCKDSRKVHPKTLPPGGTKTLAKKVERANVDSVPAGRWSDGYTLTHEYIHAVSVGKSRYSMSIIIKDSKVENVTKKISLAVVEADSTAALISLENLPVDLADLGTYISHSPSKVIDGKERGHKVLPVGEQTFTVEYKLADGTITTIDVTMTAWLNKEHVKAAETALEAKRKADEEAAHKEAFMAKQAELMQNFTPEQIQAMQDLWALQFANKGNK
jgi:hypothetical protein